MRDKICKAQRKDNREWVEGFYFCMVHNDGRHVHHFIIPIGVDLSLGTPIEKIQVEIDIDTLCDDTGLTDKNGNKIWENDIVVRVDRRNGIYIFREQPKMNCKVIWSDRHGFDTVPSCGYFDKNNALECEVIGNIFDNPELLKGGADGV